MRWNLGPSETAWEALRGICPVLDLEQTDFHCLSTFTATNNLYNSEYLRPPTQNVQIEVLKNFGQSQNSQTFDAHSEKDQQTLL